MESGTVDVALVLAVVKLKRLDVAKRVRVLCWVPFHCNVFKEKYVSSIPDALSRRRVG